MRHRIGVDQGTPDCKMFTPRLVVDPRAGKEHRGGVGRKVEQTTLATVKTGCFHDSSRAQACIPSLAT